MKKFLLVGILTAILASGIGCTNMSPTEQGIVSGVVLGAAAGAGVTAVAGGTIAYGALVGAGVGGLAGGVIANQ